VVTEWPISARLLMDDGESVVRAARYGLGISQMPLFLAREAMAAGELVEVLAPYAPPPMVHTVLYANRRMVSSRIRAFVDFVGAASKATWP
jgi:LysR family transcriptional regulator, regulator for bpeEF and oprC